MKLLSGKVAIVTGSSRGIGAAIARRLGEEGASVVVNYACSRSAAEDVVQDIIATGSRAIAVQANVADQRDIERLFRAAINAFGQLDILVNNAGLYLSMPLGKITPEHFHLHYNLNVLGVILTTQEALKYFGAEGGSVINISAVLSAFSGPGTGLYHSSKSAVDGLTRTFARELAPRGIRVNSVNPGAVETDGFHEAGLLEPGDYLGRPQDVAPAVSFLASTASRWITGECVQVDGGRRMNHALQDR